MSQLTVKEVLIQARKKIEDPKNWCQVYAALNQAGNPVEPDELTACHFCAYGAIGSVAGLKNLKLKQETEKILGNAAQSLFKVGVITVNDSMGHEAILKVFDKAIKSI